MGLLEELSGGAEKVAKEAEKAFGQVKVKVEQLQVERQMDVVARKLGYMALDEYRGRPADPAERQRLLEELGRLEDQHVGPADQPAEPTEGQAPFSASPAAEPAILPDEIGGLGPPPETGSEGGTTP